MSSKSRRLRVRSNYEDEGHAGEYIRIQRTVKRVSCLKVVSAEAKYCLPGQVRRGVRADATGEDRLGPTQPQMSAWLTPKPFKPQVSAWLTPEPFKKVSD